MITNNEIMYVFGGTLIGGLGMSLFIAAKTANAISNNTEVDIPDFIIEKAATKAIKQSIAETETALINRCARMMESELKEKVKSVYEVSKEDMKTQLMERVDDYDIDDIKDAVIEKIMENVDKANRAKHVDIVEVIKASKEAGMSSFEIERIVKDLIK